MVISFSKVNPAKIFLVLHMQETYIIDKNFSRVDITENPLTRGEYEGCQFNNIDLSNFDLSNFRFTDCEFFGCNLSLASLNNTSFGEVKFKDCKMLGLRFDNCNEFGLSFSFDSCQLNHSSFYKTKIKKTIFNNTQLHEADFTETDLTGVVFSNCDFARAMFGDTILEKADFRSSYNYSINPEANRIRKAKFSLNGVVGLLNKYDIQIENTI